MHTRARARTHIRIHVRTNAHPNTPHMPAHTLGEKKGRGRAGAGGGGGSLRHGDGAGRRERCGDISDD